MIFQISLIMSQSFNIVNNKQTNKQAKNKARNKNSTTINHLNNAATY